MQTVQPPLQLTHAAPKLIYYYSQNENKEYIILTPHHEDNRKCFKYDISENEWIHFTDYPSSINPGCHTLIIDQLNNLLYINSWSKSWYETTCICYI